MHHGRDLRGLRNACELWTCSEGRTQGQRASAAQKRRGVGIVVVCSAVKGSKEKNATSAFGAHECVTGAAGGMGAIT